jgi:hypothetical protein
MKALVGVLDVIGLYFVLNAKRMISIMGDIHIKILAVGLGWAAAEILTSNFISIVLQGWSNEMKTEYFINAINCNFDLLEIITLTYLAYYLTKKETT